jgi:hypothetical protein
MPVCPECKVESKARKNDACPNCHAQVEVYQGSWFRVGTGSPAEAIVRKFEGLVSDRLQVPFAFERKSPRYKREMGLANNLLKEMGMDLDLTLEVLEALFKHERFNWKHTRSSFMDLYKDTPIALAIVNIARRERERKVSKEDAAFQQAMEREDIF